MAIDSSLSAWGSWYYTLVPVPGDYPVLYSKVLDISATYISSKEGASAADAFPQGYNSSLSNEQDIIKCFPNNLILTRPTNVPLKGTAYIKVEGKWK